MPKQLKLFFPVLLLLAGIVFLLIAELIQKFGVPQWLTLLACFLAFNLSLSHCLSFHKQLRSAWSIWKIHYVVYGYLIGLFPIVLSTVFNSQYKNLGPEIFEGISIATLLVTLAIVSWEELWFRGMVLNYAASKYTSMGASIVFALLFLLLHAFNPEIDLWKAWPDLLLGGYSLCMAYFVFNSIWAPIGMHFSNNLLESTLAKAGQPTDVSTPFYILGSLILAGLFTFLFLKRNKQ